MCLFGAIMFNDDVIPSVYIKVTNTDADILWRYKFNMSITFRDRQPTEICHTMDNILIYSKYKLRLCIYIYIYILNLDGINKIMNWFVSRTITEDGSQVIGTNMSNIEITTYINHHRRDIQTKTIWFVLCSTSSSVDTSLYVIKMESFEWVMKTILKVRDPNMWCRNTRYDDTCDDRE